MTPESIGNAHAEAFLGTVSAAASHGVDSDFSKAIKHAAEAVASPQAAANRAVQAFSRGEDGELHQTMLTMERADITLKFLMSVRNRALEAYREVMRMGS